MRPALILCCVLLVLAPDRRRQHQVTLSWTDQNPAAVRYDVWRASGFCPAGAFDRIALALSVKTYADRSVSSSSTYCYYVAAVLNGLSAVSASATAVIPR